MSLIFSQHGLHTDIHIPPQSLNPRYAPDIT